MGLMELHSNGRPLALPENIRQGKTVRNTLAYYVTEFSTALKRFYNRGIWLRRHYTQHNDTQHNNTQHNNTQHSDTQHNNTQQNGTYDINKNATMSITTRLQFWVLFCWVSLCWACPCWVSLLSPFYAECGYAECRGALIATHKHYYSFN